MRPANYGSICQSNINRYTLCWPGGSIGIDNAHNIYLADESNNRIARFALPYEPYQEGEAICLPNANGGLAASDSEDNPPNSVSAYKFTESMGVFTFENQLVVKDKERFLIWTDYLGREPGAEADFIVGQDSEDVRISNEFQLGEHSFHTIDDKNRLWSFNAHGKIVVYQLPFHEGDEPLANYLPLYWKSGEEADYSGSANGYGGLAFDDINKKMWVVDNKYHRLLGVGNYDEFQNRLYIEMVIGQPNENSTKCNHDQDYAWIASGPAKANGLCAPTQIKFDQLGNLYVVENSYEGHGNIRISVWMADKIREAINGGQLYPNIAAEKVFVQDSLNSEALFHDNYGDKPSSPVSIAFNSKNQMAVANDGSYQGWGMSEDRYLRQLWFYNDPLKKDSNGHYIQNQSADGYIKLPIGVPAELWFDEDDNLIVQDGSWCRAWVINLDRDPSLLEWLGPIPPPPTPQVSFQELIINYGSNYLNTDLNGDSFVNGLDFSFLLAS